MKNIGDFFLSENFQLLDVNVSIILNRRVFVMVYIWPGTFPILRVYVLF